MEIGELIRETKLSNITHEQDGIVALLTSEQFKKIKESEKDLCEFNRDCFDPLYSKTYINPSQVIEYFVDNEKFKGSPNQEVVINFKDEWGESVILNAPGSYVFFIEKNKKRKEILVGTISKEEVFEKKIESRYIKKDYSGVIIPVTRGILESELNERKELVDRGYRENFLSVEKLAKISEIDFSKELKEARDYDKQQYLKRYARKEHLDSVFELLRENGDLFLNENCSFSDTICEFLDIAHLIEYPDEIYKNKAIKYLEKVSETFLGESRSIKRELEEIVKSKEGEIKELEDKAIKTSWKRRKLQGESINI